MARTLEVTGDYRIIRHLKRRPRTISPPGTPVRLGLVVDVESTGLDPRHDEIIEIAIMSFLHFEHSRSWLARKMMMGRKKRERGNGPHPLNLLDKIYDHDVGPSIPQEHFSITKEDLISLESALGGVSLVEHKDMLEFVCREFANTVAFQAHRVSKSELDVYARDIAETCDRLVNLLRQPEKVRIPKGVRGKPNYTSVHQLLMANWQIAQSRISRDQLSELTDRLNTLANDVRRISEDHAPKHFRGPPPDLGLNYLLIYLNSIATGAAGGKLALPANEDQDYSTELRDFALAILEFAVRRAKHAIDSIDLPEQARADAYAALNWYSKGLNPTRLLRFSENWFLKTPEKREQRRKKTVKATSANSRKLVPMAP